jgi:hypothetical protein
LREPQTLDRQAINVRRRVITLAVATHISVAEVVCHDEDDVRFWRLRPACTTKANPCQRQRTRLDKSTTRERVLLLHMSLLFWTVGNGRGP